VLIATALLPAHSPENHSFTPRAKSSGTTYTDRLLQHAAELSRLSPRAALENPEISSYFSHYIRVIAPLYDLNDATNTFSVVVTAYALDHPVLFRAIIALSSSHWSKVRGSSQEIAFAFYAACVEDLLKALNSALNFPGEYLAAACLLQLYEVLNSNLLSLHPPYRLYPT